MYSKNLRSDTGSTPYYLPHFQLNALTNCRHYFYFWISHGLLSGKLHVNLPKQYHPDEYIYLVTWLNLFEMMIWPLDSNWIHTQCYPYQDILKNKLSKILRKLQFLSSSLPISNTLSYWKPFKCVIQLKLTG